MIFSSVLKSYSEYSLKVGRGGRDRFVRDDELESDNRSPLVSRSNPVAAAFAFCKFEKERLSPTTPASERITLAIIGAWHNSLDRMPAVILSISFVKVFFSLDFLIKETY